MNEADDMSAWESEILEGSPASDTRFCQPVVEVSMPSLATEVDGDLEASLPFVCDCGKRFATGPRLGGHKRSQRDCPIHSKANRDPLAQREGNASKPVPPEKQVSISTTH